jgi:hypothetical protein
MKHDFVVLNKKKLFSKHQANTRLVIGTHERLENDCVQFHTIILYQQLREYQVIADVP